MRSSTLLLFFGVRSSDILSEISQQVYGDANQYIAKQYMKILEANGDDRDEPAVIKPRDLE